MLRSIATRVAWACAALALVCAPQEALSKRLDRVSFEKPFDAIDADGGRLVSDDFEAGGTAAVNRHFVRLTPDRQSKRGYIWGKQQLGTREFEAVLTFRISGQAKSWFGDGLALWITDSQKYVQGDNHGFIGNFKGFGVVFDTFVNQEHGGGHKDVTFFENDGSKTLDQLNEMDKVGCMAPGIRYHEKNANFNPSTSLSRAKIQYKAQQLTISIDAAGTGKWEPCYSQRITISDDWMDRAVMGITASTGGLADNHDVIGLSVYDQVDDSEVTTRDEKQKNDTSRELEEELSMGDSDAKLRVIKRKYLQLLEDFEYQFTALKESTENSIRKLKEQEKEDEKRIAELEAWANGKMTERVSSTVDAIRDQVDEKLQQTVEETAAKSGGWKTPFLLFVLVVGAVVAAGYKKYQDLRKSHLL